MSQKKVKMYKLQITLGSSVASSSCREVWNLWQKLKADDVEFGLEAAYRKGFFPFSFLDSSQVMAMTGEIP